jgi:hypothetical protein
MLGLVFGLGLRQTESLRVSVLQLTGAGSGSTRQHDTEPPGKRRAIA